MTRDNFDVREVLRRNRNADARIGFVLAVVLTIALAAIAGYYVGKGRWIEVLGAGAMIAAISAGIYFTRENR